MLASWTLDGAPRLPDLPPTMVGLRLVKGGKG
jgi:hypothetical protein